MVKADVDTSSQIFWQTNVLIQIGGMTSKKVQYLRFKIATQTIAELAQ